MEIDYELRRRLWELRLRRHMLVYYDLSARDADQALAELEERQILLKDPPKTVTSFGSVLELLSNYGIIYSYRESILRFLLRWPFARKTEEYQELKGDIDYLKQRLNAVQHRPRAI